MNSKLIKFKLFKITVKIGKNVIDFTNGFKYVLMKSGPGYTTHVFYTNSIYKLIIRLFFNR